MSLPFTNPEWDNKDNFLRVYDPIRAIYRPATRLLVQDILITHMLPGQRWLEIGSGIGELVSLAPDFAEQIQQTEYGDKNVIYNRMMHRSKGKTSNVMRANVYSLPFADNEYDGVIGYSVFDTFQDTNAALSEMRRVTKPGGAILHMLDLVASLDPYFDDRETDGRYSLPCFHRNNDDRGYSSASSSSKTCH